MPEIEEGAKKEKSAGAIIYYAGEKGHKFLLLKYKTYWGFAKGVIEAEESMEETMKREVREETNLDNFRIIPGFRYAQRWFFRAEGRLVSKEAIFLLVKVTEEQASKVKISFEHEDFKWLGYEEALSCIKIKNNKEMLKSAYDFVKKYEEQKKLL
ncbi:NUDIX domain-containing protein [Candidatus Pacearchaeota archaeon]|nr:NUDIX domain-containing protein [Candidatus Pacearchaeota archaeon]